jgi:xanthine permease XanP
MDEYQRVRKENHCFKTHSFMKKPSNIVYGVDDKPPVFSNIFLGFQHVMILFISLIFPVVIIGELGNTVSEHSARSFISLTMIAAGTVTILHAIKRGPVGSGYMCPSLASPSYYSASLLAVQTGGLSLLFGMTGIAGVLESVFSRFMHKLRFLFPPEVTGVVVTLVGITVIPLGINQFFGLNHTDTVSLPEEVFVAIICLVTMVALNVFTKGKLKLFCTLIGIIVGYILSYFAGIIPESDLEQISNATFMYFPYIEGMNWKFNPTLFLPFLIAVLCSTLKTIGDVATCQKINDANWRRPDMKNISGGILADGCGGIISGLIGGFGQSTSSSNIGLSVATGATSRYIAYSTGIIIIVLAFFPKFASIFLIMPKPVMGATLLFTISFMIIQGLQIIMSRMLDARKTFVVGLSLILGLSADMAPGIYANTQAWLQPVVSSSLSLGAISAVVLNLFLRMGLAKRRTLTVNQQTDYSVKIFDFMDKQGAAWGARQEIIFNAASAMSEFAETAFEMGFSRSEIIFQVSFDEQNLNVEISYTGSPIPFPDARPSADNLTADEDFQKNLSGFMIKKYADRVTTKTKNGSCTVKLNFDH